MTLTPVNDTKSQLRRDEGDVPYFYLDHLGYATIGVGFLIDKRKGGSLPPAVRDFWLDWLIDEKRRALRNALAWFDRLDDVRKGVLLNMAYQLGVPGLLEFHATLALVRDGHYDQAADEMLDSDWARQTPERAKRLSRQMKTGEWQ